MSASLPVGLASRHRRGGWPTWSQDSIISFHRIVKDGVPTARFRRGRKRREEDNNFGERSAMVGESGVTSPY